MAFERSFSVSLRYFLLIGLLILIIHTLSSDYGVNGEDQPGNDKQKPADKGVTGAKESYQQKQTPRKKLRRKTTLSPLVSNTAKPGIVDDSKPLPNVPEKVPPKPSGEGGLKGPIGKQDAKQATKVEDKDEDIEKDKEEDIEKGNKGEKPSNTGLSGAANDKSKLPLKKKQAADDVSSAGSFMTYFIIIAIIVIIGYLILHNKKKLMGYIVEGRNTGRARRQRPTSGNGSEYKPLKNADEVSGGKPEEA